MTILMFSWRTRRPQFPPVPWCGSRARWEGRRSSEILKSKHWNVLLLSLYISDHCIGPSHLLTLAMRLKVWWTPVSTRTLSRKTISSQTTRRQNWAELAASDLQVWISTSVVQHPTSSLYRKKTRSDFQQWDSNTAWAEVWLAYHAANTEKVVSLRPWGTEPTPQK